MGWIQKKTSSDEELLKELKLPKDNAKCTFNLTKNSELVQTITLICWRDNHRAVFNIAEP